MKRTTVFNSSNPDDWKKLRDKLADGIVGILWRRRHKGLSDAPEPEAEIVRIEPVTAETDVEEFDADLPDWMTDETPVEPAEMPQWLLDAIQGGDIVLPTEETPDWLTLLPDEPESLSDSVVNANGVEVPAFLRKQPPSNRTIVLGAEPQTGTPLENLDDLLGLSQPNNLIVISGGTAMPAETIGREDWRIKRGTAVQYIECAKRHNILPAKARDIKPNQGQSAARYVQYLIEKCGIADAPRSDVIYDMLVADGVIIDPNSASEQIRQDEPIVNPLHDTQPRPRIVNAVVADQPNLDSILNTTFDDEPVVLPASPNDQQPQLPPRDVRVRHEKRKAKPASTLTRVRNVAIAIVIIVGLFGCFGCAIWAISFLNSMDTRTPGVDWTQFSDASGTATQGAPATQTREAGREATANFVGTQQTSLTLTPGPTIEPTQDLPTIMPTICATQQGNNTVTLGCNTSGQLPTPFPSPTLAPLG